MCSGTGASTLQNAVATNSSCGLDQTYLLLLLSESGDETNVWPYSSCFTAGAVFQVSASYKSLMPRRVSKQCPACPLMLSQYMNAVPDMMRKNLGLCESRGSAGSVARGEVRVWIAGQGR